MGSVCIRCGGPKELPLGRCAACGHLPHRGEAALSVLASRRMLGERELLEVQARIQRGEPLRPSAARLRAAEALLGGEGEDAPPLRAGQLLGLAGATLLFSPVLAFAGALAWRDTVRGKQALVIGAASTVLLTFAWFVLRLAPFQGPPVPPP